MALLIVTQDGKVEAGVISGRVSIGRRPEDQVCIQDKSISPVHAWIGLGDEGSIFIADAGSKTGTFVNDQRISERRTLQWGDRIRVGPLSLWLAEGHAIPHGAKLIDLSERPTAPPSPSRGISFDCECGAPIWVPWEYAGKSGQCRSCGRPIVVPEPPAARLRVCAVCHGSIHRREETTRCPACGAEFHLECWNENGGCSVYGCSQVSVVQQPPDPSMRVVQAFTPDATPLGGETMPWAYVLLAASVLGAVFGALTFGAPAFLAALAAVVYLLRGKPRWQRRIVLLSIAVALIGSLAGMVLSYYWWIGGNHGR